MEDLRLIGDDIEDAAELDAPAAPVANARSILTDAQRAALGEIPGARVRVKRCGWNAAITRRPANDVRAPDSVARTSAG